MGVRRKARECALQMLFQYDMSGNPATEVLATFWAMNPAPTDLSAEEVALMMEFANRLFSGAILRLTDIDEIIKSHTTNWRLERMAVVDRNVLRLAVYEFLEEETPKAVVINEALEIAKRFSTEESAHFVNGILDGIKNSLGKAVNC